MTLNVWNGVARGAAASETPGAVRNQPRATGVLDLQHNLKVVCPPGEILRSGAHLHVTVPNTSERSRFNIDVRTAHIDELACVGAPALDRTCTGRHCSSYDEFSTSHRCR